MRRILKVVTALAVGVLTFHSFRLSGEILRGGAAFGFYERIKKTDNKLRLVFHVGPGKMGSSTIQRVLVQSVDTLKDDNWVRYHHVSLGGLNRCIVKGGCQNEIKRFQDFLHRAEQEKRNIVLSTETWFSVSRELSWYQELFNSTAYEVTVIVAYRRYYNWLPSRYYQLNRFRCRPIQLNQANMGRVIPPLNAYLSKTPLGHPSVHKIARVSPYFDNIQVINIETGDLLQDFFCKILDARKTCRGLQSDRPASKNQGKALSSDRLAQYLIENGMVDPVKVEKMAKDLKLRVPRYGEAECTSLAMILEMHDERNGAKLKNGDFPLLCPPTNVTDRLFNVSAEAERVLFPNEYSLDSVWRDFSTKVNTTLLCDIDLQAVVADETWQKLFEKLGGP